MPLCHNCPRRTEGCSASCVERAEEKLVEDIIKIDVRKQRKAERSADAVTIIAGKPA